MWKPSAVFIADVPIEQQVSPDSTSPSSQTHLPSSDHHDDISIDSYRGYPSPTNYKGTSPDGSRARSPGVGGPDTTDNISNQQEMEEEEGQEQINAEVRSKKKTQHFWEIWIADYLKVQIELLSLFLRLFLFRRQWNPPEVN